MENIAKVNDITAYMERDFLKGIKGEKGDKGDTGEQGLQGPAGPQGERGEQGPVGEKFRFEDFTPEQLAELKGEKGDKGEQGEKGDKGDKGDIGTSNTLTIGSVTKGEQAEANISGEAPNQVLNLVLPKGDTGLEGPRGYTPLRGIDYFTQEDVQTITADIIDEVNSFDVAVVQSLPVENIKSKTIYFVPKLDAKQQDVYDEFIYIEGSWEHIGTTEVDLSNYYNKTEADKKMKAYTATILLPENTVISNGYEVEFPNIKYQVGNNSLELRLNTEVLKLASDTEDGHYKEVGEVGSLSNKIQFYRTETDGNWTLSEPITITAIVRGVAQEEVSENGENA